MSRPPKFSSTTNTPLASLAHQAAMDGAEDEDSFLD